MNLNEVQRLIENVQTFCPAQVFTDAACDVWATELAPYAAPCVAAAARELMTAPRDSTDRPRYLHLGDLLSRARRIARDQTARVPLPAAPPAAYASPEAFDEWSRDQMQARNTGNMEAFLKKWHGGTNPAITRGDR